MHKYVGTSYINIVKSFKIIIQLQDMLYVKPVCINNNN